MALSLPQRRYDDRYHVEPPIKILAEFVFLHLLQKIAVASGNDPRVDSDRLSITDPFKLALL